MNKKKTSKQLYNESLELVPKETKLLVKKLLDFSDKVNQIMQNTGMTKKQLSAQTGIDEKDLNYILGGRKNLTLEEVVKIENILNIELLVINHLI